MTISASFFDNLYKKNYQREKNSLKKSVFMAHNIHKKMSDLNGYYNDKSKIESKCDSD